MNTKILAFTISTLLSGQLLAEDGPPGGREFAGINFGVGVSLTVDTGNNDRVESASLDQAGIVRVSRDQNDIARIMLETHYFFQPKNKLFGIVDGHGPFVALQPGTDEIIEAIGLGWMVGFKRGEAGTNDSWNFGVGLCCRS